MPTVCSAYGCTYRHKKGDNIGMYCFPKDETLRELWTVAVRRSNWKPSPASRICGKHFQSGKPSKDENHPDYVPSVFIFNQNKNRKEHWQKVAEEKASQRVAEILHGAPKVDVTGYRRLKPKLEGYGVPFIVKARKADKSQPANPVIESCHFSTMMKKNNAGNKKTVEASSSNGKFLIHKEMKPSVPQRVWVLNFDSKQISNDSVEKPKEVISETASFASLKKSFPKSVSDSSIMIYEDSEPLCVESSMTVSDDSTLTAESSIPDIYADTEDVKPCEATSRNGAFLYVDEIENVSNNPLNNKSAPLVSSVTEDTTDSDYSEFKSTPFDSKEVLAIKLETMLAVNISLKQKVKFYQNKCSQYETEMINLKDTIGKLKQKYSISHN